MTEQGRREAAAHPLSGPLNAFLPLSEDPAVLSTRGQTLPSIVRSLSVQHVHPLRERRSSNFEDGRIAEEGAASAPGSPHPSIRSIASMLPAALMTPQMRSQRLVGNSNPRYQWDRYWKTEEELKLMRKPIRKYYERNNFLIQRYKYIDMLLDSSLPHNLIQEYNQPNVTIPTTIEEESPLALSPVAPSPIIAAGDGAADSNGQPRKVKRTPKNLYKVPDEEMPLLRASSQNEGDEEGSDTPEIPLPTEDEADAQSAVVKTAIYVNMAANAVLLIMKIFVTITTSSVSVLASLVDAALDFLSTGIVWTTTKLISKRDRYQYPVGRQRLEPIGVLVFSVIMITSFFQVALEGCGKLTSGDHRLIQLTGSAIGIMGATVLVKGLCYIYCRLIKNSSVQMLAEDAWTDCIFNSFSILFPLIGFYANIWWLDPLGGIFLSLYVIIQWARTSTVHIRNLSLASASTDQRNVILYLAMRFSRSITHIQGLNAYSVGGEKIWVELDVVLDESLSLRDAHDLGESLQYVVESYPLTDRAFVHLDYSGYNLPTHMEQQE